MHIEREEIKKLSTFSEIIDYLNNSLKTVAQFSEEHGYTNPLSMHKRVKENSNFKKIKGMILLTPEMEEILKKTLPAYRNILAERLKSTEPKESC